MNVFNWFTNLRNKSNCRTGNHMYERIHTMEILDNFAETTQKLDIYDFSSPENLFSSYVIKKEIFMGIGRLWRYYGYSNTCKLCGEFLFEKDY